MCWWAKKEVGNLDFFSLFFLNVATAELLWLSLLSIWKIWVYFLTLHLPESFDKISLIRTLFLILKVIPRNLIISKWAGWNIGNETGHAQSVEKNWRYAFCSKFFHPFQKNFRNILRKFRKGSRKNSKKFRKSLGLSKLFRK